MRDLEYSGEELEALPELFGEDPRLEVIVNIEQVQRHCGKEFLIDSQMNRRIGASIWWFIISMDLNITSAYFRYPNAVNVINLFLSNDQ
jgi:hypothetical protein